MRKTILTILATAVLATSAAQIAAAAERHNTRKIYREPAPISQPVRDSNAYWPTSPAQSDWSRYENGAVSAPAGR